MSPRLVLFALAVTLLVSVAGNPTAVDAQIPDTTISGGELPFELRLAPVDADDFRRRVNPPPRLDEAPEATGPSYLITTDYWQRAVRRESDEEDLRVEPQATYFPDGGYVHTRLDGEDVWIVIDLRQRAILDRYIRLALDGAITSAPGALDVLVAALPGETISVEYGGELLPAETLRELLESVTSSEAVFPDPPQPPNASGGRWLVFTLTEGRALHYLYDGSTLTDLQGTELYDAAAAAGVLTPPEAEPVPSLTHEEPAGSLLWWPVMLGGGIAALSAAVWLRRRHGGPL